MANLPHDRERSTPRSASRDVAATRAQTPPPPQRCALRYLIGREETPVIVIDGFLDPVGALLEQAYGATYGTPKTNFFPGVRAPAPASYAGIVARATAPLIRSAFNLAGGRANLISSDFSLITTSPQRLSAAQRVPHTDGTDGRLFAILHYLVADGCFGTRFFRHRTTGYEQVTDERKAEYKATLRDELARSDLQGYVSEDDGLFERTYEIEGRFNRLVIYPGHVLHSGAVTRDFGFDPDPRRGRLTANSFIKFDLGGTGQRS